jgi:hypothetical protein
MIVVSKANIKRSVLGGNKLKIIAVISRMDIRLSYS